MFCFNCCQRAPPSPESSGGESETSSSHELGLKPTDAPDTHQFDLIRAHSRVGEARILKHADSSPTGSSPSRSLLEASARRMASGTTPSAEELDVDDHGIPRRFLDSYLSAVGSGDSRWAIDVPAISDMFADNAKMTTQDGQTLHGKPAVLRQLEKGVGMLIKMAGKSSEVPEIEIGETAMTTDRRHVLACKMRRGLRSFSFQLEFSIRGGKVVLLKNVRT